MSTDAHFKEDLDSLRGKLTRQRRAQAASNDLDGVIETQRRINYLDEAIDDEHRIYSKEHRPFMAFI